MFDWVQIGGIWGLINHVYTVFPEPFLNLIYSMDRDVILYKNETVIPVIEEPLLENFNIGVGSIPKFHGVEVSRQNE